MAQGADIETPRNAIDSTPRVTRAADLIPFSSVSSMGIGLAFAAACHICQLYRIPLPHMLDARTLRSILCVVQPRRDHEFESQEPLDVGRGNADPSSLHVRLRSGAHGLDSSESGC